MSQRCRLATSRHVPTGDVMTTPCRPRVLPYHLQSSFVRCVLLLALLTACLPGTGADEASNLESRIIRTDGGDDECLYRWTLPEHLEFNNFLGNISSGGDALQPHYVMHNVTGETRLYVSNLHINPHLAEYGGTGGEPVSQVVNQTDRKELPDYKKGAFSCTGCEGFNKLMSKERELYPGTERALMYLGWVRHGLTNVTQESASKECSPKLALLTARTFAHSIFHTMMDWWEFYNMIPDAKRWKNIRDEVEIIFIDSRPAGLMESTWSDLFTPNVRYLDSYKENPTCYKRAIFVPSGYRSPLWREKRVIPRPRCGVVFKGFQDLWLQSYGLEDVVQDDPPLVTIIDRQHYDRGTGSDIKVFQRVVTPETMMELRDTISSGLINDRVETAVFDTLSMKEQLRLIRRTQVLVGIHGAGLTWMLLLARPSLVVEMSGSHRHSYDQDLAQWREEDDCKVVHLFFKRVGYPDLELQPELQNRVVDAIQTWRDKPRQQQENAIGTVLAEEIVDETAEL